MTNPTPHGQVPEALRLAHIFDNPLPPEWPDMVAAAAELRRQHARIAELEALGGVQSLSLQKATPAGVDKAQAAINSVAGGGVQALSAAPEAIAKLRHLYQNMVDGAVRDTASAKRIAEGLLAPAIEALERATPPAEQQATCTNSDSWNCKYCNKTKTCAALAHAGQPPAPKAAPGVGNSGFDHKTAADLLNNKTVSDEAVRKFVAVSRWAHDERSALSATLLAMHGVLTSHEAEIALLKKALLEAEAAPQQEAQEPCPTCVALARTVMLDQVSFDRKPDCYGIRQITDDESVEEWEDIRTSPDVAREEANDMMATGRGEIYEVVPLWTTPQPAPDCHHRPPCDECAALAAQGGKCPMRIEP